MPVLKWPGRLRHRTIRTCCKENVTAYWADHSPWQVPCSPNRPSPGCLLLCSHELICYGLLPVDTWRCSHGNRGIGSWKHDIWKLGVCSFRRGGGLTHRGFRIGARLLHRGFWRHGVCSFSSRAIFSYRGIWKLGDCIFIADKVVFSNAGCINNSYYYYYRWTQHSVGVHQLSSFCERSGFCHQGKLGSSSHTICKSNRGESLEATTTPCNRNARISSLPGAMEGALH